MYNLEYKGKTTVKKTYQDTDEYLQNKDSAAAAKEEPGSVLN